MSFTVQSVRDYLRERVRLDVDIISDDDLLFSSGLIDSFEMAGVILFIEESTGLRLGPADITVDNFDSISRMVALVESHNANAKS